MDFIDKNPEFIRQNGRKTTLNTLGMSVYVLVEKVVAGSTPIKYPTIYVRFLSESLFFSIFGATYAYVWIY